MGLETSQVEEVLSEVVRPLVRADGGDIALVAVTDDVVRVRLSGSCRGCPGLAYTRSGLIEAALTRALGRAIQVQIER